jgi:lysophospholipase
MSEIDREYFTTRDGICIRYGIWHRIAGPVRGSVVLLHGRNEFLEKYLETIGDLNRKGYDVYSFDWRGQGLSQRLLPDRLKGHIKNYACYLQDLEDFFTQIMPPQAVRPLVFLAHSMGAQIALRFLHDHSGMVERAILTAPLIDIKTGIYPRWLVKSLTWLALKTGFARAFVPEVTNRNSLKRNFEGNLLTSDPERFLVEKMAVTRNPDLALGGLTFGWLAATLTSTSFIMQTEYLQQIRTPIVIVNGGLDRVVSGRAQKVVCARMPNCRLVVIDRARHEILMETDRIRSEFWKIFDAFVE